MGINYNPSIVTNGLVLCLDAANPKSFSPNVFTGSQDIYSWYVSRSGNNFGNNCTLSQDYNTSRSPAGGIPLKMSVTGNDPALNSYNSAPWNISAVQNGQTWTLSVYVKGSVVTTGELILFGANSAGTSFVGDNWLGIAGKTINITTEWSRQELSITFNNADITYIHMRLDGPNSDGSGQDIWWDGLQIELGSNPTVFKPLVNTNGINWNDLSGGARNFTLTNGPTFSSANGGTFTFDGTDDYATNGNTDFSIANNLFADANGSWTVSAWFRFPISPTTTRTANAAWMVVGRGGGIATGATFGLFVGSATDTTYGAYAPYKLACVVRGSVTVISSGSVNDNIWHNACVTWNGSTGETYLDGAKTADVVNVIGAALQAAAVTVGTTGSTATASAFEGSISNTIIYNRALTAAEIARNFNALRGRYGV